MTHSPQRRPFFILVSLLLISICITCGYNEHKYNKAILEYEEALKKYEPKFYRVKAYDASTDSIVIIETPKTGITYEALLIEAAKKIYPDCKSVSSVNQREATLLVGS